jgi:glycosyltransferase involved in cell wall biosynthesis
VADAGTPAPARLPAAGVLHLDAGRTWAGGQNQARLLMRGLAARGIRQTMVCPAGSPTQVRLGEEGLPVVGIPWRGPTDPRAVWALGRTVSSWSLVHCHDAHALQVALLPCRLARVPLVASRRVHYGTSPTKWNLADAVVAISGTVAEALKDSGIHPDRIHLVPSGIDVEEIEGLPPMEPSFRSLLGLDSKAFLAGNIGHLHAYKGQSVIPRAAAGIPGIVWAIVGEGPQREVLEGLIQEEGVGDRVHLTGAIPDARRLLRELDLFVFPSVDEALGTSLLDAMAAGIPVVAADAAGPREVLDPLRHGPAGGGLFPPGDAGALAGLVAGLARDAGLRRALAAAQRERLRAFEAEATVEGNLAVYRSVLERR